MEEKTEYIIRIYFGKHFSKQVISLFGRWFRASECAASKDIVMEKLWEESPSVVTAQTWANLNQLKQQIPAFSLTQKTKRTKINWISYAASIALVIASVATTLYYTSLPPQIKTEVAQMDEFFVPFGEKRQIVLADGSEVWVNAGSMIIYPETFNGNDRSIYLIGEARFVVAKNPEKPFIVKTNHLEIEALGTIFNVAAYPNEPTTTATLEEGSVRVDLKGSNIESSVLKPNEQLVYNHLARRISITEVDATQTGLWKNGYLIFENTNFGTLVSTLERKYNVEISYDTSKYGARVYNVKFNPDESLDDVLLILKQLAGIKYSKDKNKVFIY